MTTITEQTRGLFLLFEINRSRLLFTATILAALWVGSMLGQALLNGL